MFVRLNRRPPSRVDRVLSRSADRDGDRRGEKSKCVLVTGRQEEPVAQMHEQYRAEHVTREEHRDDTGEQADYQRDAAKEFQGGIAGPEMAGSGMCIWPNAPVTPANPKPNSMRA